MRANQASDKAFQSVKDFARKTDKEEAFWERFIQTWRGAKGL